MNARDFRCFFSTGGGWGVFSQRVGGRSHEVRLEVRHGEVRLRRLGLRNEAGFRAAALSAAPGPGAGAASAKVRVEGEGLDLDFGSEVVIGEGQSLGLTLAPAVPAKQ